MQTPIGKFMLVAATAAFMIGGTAQALAQTAASATAQAPAVQDAKAAAKEAKRQARMEARAKRKAERKAARAKNSAELKKLEDAGYKPNQDDLNYPENLQNAQKKAAPAGASQ